MLWRLRLIQVNHNIYYNFNRIYKAMYMEIITITITTITLMLMEEAIKLINIKITNKI